MKVVVIYIQDDIHLDNINYLAKHYYRDRIVFNNSFIITLTSAQLVNINLNFELRMFNSIEREILI